METDYFVINAIEKEEVSEGLNSVETSFIPRLQKKVIVVSEGLNSVETRIPFDYLPPLL